MMADQSNGVTTQGNVAEYSVKDLAFAIKRTVEDAYGYVRLRGEISGYRGPHSSGHHYFALKDDKAKIEAVIWRGNASKLRFRPEEGMEVVATGKITTFPNGSKYQIVIEQLEPAGEGALMALLEARKKKLQAEGLFDEQRKRPLPFLPRVVGVVTSPTGAVIRDILHVFEGRFPVHVMVWPVRVQGDTSATEVARAIEGFNAFHPQQRPPGGLCRPDVLIVARGGGSLEDLWGFNEEIVARAVAGSQIPIISAVGHETDTTLIDYVSDARASTPTKAAETAVPLFSDLVTRIGEFGIRLSNCQRRLVDQQRQRLMSLSRGLPRPVDLVAMPRQRLDGASSRLGRGLHANAQVHRNRFERLSGRHGPAALQARVQRAHDRLSLMSDLSRRELAARVAQARDRLDGNARLLQTLSYQRILSRGFALVRDGNRKPIRSRDGVAEDAVFSIEFADGPMDAVRVANGNNRSPRDSRNAAAKSSKSPATENPKPRKPKAREAGASREPEDQGSLF